MTFDQFCNENGLKVSSSSEGVALVGRDGRHLTLFYSDEEALAAAELVNADAILVANQVELPSQRTINRYRKALAATEKRIKAELPRTRKKLDELSALAGAELVDEVVSVLRRSVAAEPAHLAEIARCRALTEQTSSRLFLPLGATVRMKRDWDIPDHSALDPNIRWSVMPRPPKGTIGYVTGSGFGSDECSVAVAFPNEFADKSGQTWNRNLYGIVLVVHMSDVEVVEFATRPDGSPNLSVDWSRTHMIDYGRGPAGGKASVMILENRGKKMLIFGGNGFNPFDEGVQFFDSLEEAQEIHPKFVPVKVESAPAPAS